LLKRANCIKFSTGIWKEKPMTRLFRLVLLLVLATISAPVCAGNFGLTQGTPELKSAGSLAFGPSGILFVADPQSAAVFAIDTGDTAGNPEKVSLNVEGIDDLIAGLGTTPDDILINDLAVNPLSGKAYLSVSRGRGPDAAPVLLTVDGEGNVAEFPLAGVAFARADLPNAPADGPFRSRSRPPTMARPSKSSTARTASTKHGRPFARLRRTTLTRRHTCWPRTPARR
jgi:hypothetical protein